jgi:hypothetical protein
MRRQPRYLDMTVMFVDRPTRRSAARRFGNFGECFIDLDPGKAPLERLQGQAVFFGKGRAQRASSSKILIFQLRDSMTLSLNFTVTAR